VCVCSGSYRQRSAVSKSNLLKTDLPKRYAIKLLSSFITGFVGLCLVLIVPNALGPIAFGQFSFIQQFFSQITAFLDAGTSTAFFTKLSAKTDRKELIKVYGLFSFGVLFFLYFSVTSAYFSGLNTAIFPNIPIRYLYFGAFFGFLVWLTQVYIKISDAYVLTVSVEIIKIVHKLLSLLLLSFMIYFMLFDLTLYFYFHFISLVSFLAIVTLLFLKKDIVTGKVLVMKVKYKEMIREFYNYASPLFIFNSIAILIAMFDIWLLQYVSGSVQTGFYGIAYSIAAMCFLFTGAMTQIIAREFSKSFAEHDIENIRRLFEKYVPVLYVVAAYFGVFLAFQSENLLRIFVSDEFEGAHIVLIIMAFYPIHQTYGQLNSSFFFSTENTRQYRNIGLISSLIGLALSFIFIYELEMGAVGFAFKMVLGQLIGVNIQLYFIARFLKVKLVTFLKHQAIGPIFFVTVCYILSLVPWLIENSALELVFNGFLYTALVAIGFFLFPSVLGLKRMELVRFIHKIKNRFC
jgi:O-antigen/teichoic acid export membrane protein